MTGLEPKVIPTPQQIISEAESMGYDKFYVLMSGGKDSVSLAHYLDSLGKLGGVLHIQTNIGIKKTTDFVKELCNEKGWELFVREPTPKFTYVSMVLEHGFPSSGVHTIVMRKLKYITMRDFLKERIKLGEKPCFVSGVRRKESVRRMGNYQTHFQQDGKMAFICPFFYKSSSEVWEYCHMNNLRITPVYDYLSFSGECMCGCFAQKEEKKLIEQKFPELVEFIDWLEYGVKKFGTKEAQRFPTWGNTGTMEDIKNQTTIDLNDNLICGTECAMVNL